MRKSNFIPLLSSLIIILLVSCGSQISVPPSPSPAFISADSLHPSETIPPTETVQSTFTYKPPLVEDEPIFSLKIDEKSVRFLEEVKRLTSPDDSTVSVLAYSPDGTLLATGGSGDTWGGIVRLWDSQTGILKAVLKGHTGDINGLAFINNNKIASVSSDHTGRLWDVSTGNNTDMLYAHLDSVTAVAASPDGHWLVTGSKDNTVILWDVVNKSQSPPLPVPGLVSSIAFGLDSTKVAVSIWGTGPDIEILDIPFLSELKDLDFPATGDYVKAVALSPNGRFLAAIKANPVDPNIVIWNIRDEAQILSIKVQNDQVNSVAFSPDGMLLVATNADSSIQIWNAYTGELLKTLHHNGSATDAILSPDGTTLATAGLDNTFRFWRIPASALAPSVKTRTALVPTPTSTKPTSTPPMATPGCSGTYSRLQLGKYAIVSAGAVPNRVRSEPRVSTDNIIGLLYPGTFGKIIGGPVCADGLVFWQLANDSIKGGSGWTAEGDGKEYWLDPFDPLNP